MSSFTLPSPLERITFKSGDVSIWVKRDDLIHSEISGNKYRKLHLNLENLQNKEYSQIVTFGGAHSNHIDAISYLTREENIKCLAIIRGEQPTILSPTLTRARNAGVELRFVSRLEYQQRNEPEYLDTLQKEHPHAYIIPEGGANDFGVAGCENIITECQEQIDFDYISIDCGTGATLAGMVRALKPYQKAIGVQVLKGQDFISAEVHRFNPNKTFNNFSIWTDYHFGGYAKYEDELIDFMQSFYQKTGIKLDPVYTGKQFFAVFDQINKGYFPKGSRIVLTHSGGLQGIKGFEERYNLSIYD